MTNVTTDFKYKLPRFWTSSLSAGVMGELQVTTWYRIRGSVEMATITTPVCLNELPEDDDDRRARQKALGGALGRYRRLVWDTVFKGRSAP